MWLVWGIYVSIGELYSVVRAVRGWPWQRRYNHLYRARWTWFAWKQEANQWPKVGAWQLGAQGLYLLNFLVLLTIHLILFRIFLVVHITSFFFSSFNLVLVVNWICRIALTIKCQCGWYGDTKHLIATLGRSIPMMDSTWFEFRMSLFLSMFFPTIYYSFTSFILYYVGYWLLAWERASKVRCLQIQT